MCDPLISTRLASKQPLILKRDVFIRSDTLDLSQDELSQIVKLLYEWDYSGDYWGETLNEHHLENLRMQQADDDFSLFFHHVCKKPSGMSVTWLGDILRSGNTPCMKYSIEAIHSAFDAKDAIFNEFTFTGIRISGTKEHLKLSQGKYIAGLPCLEKEENYDQFRLCRHKLAWTIHTRPDVAYAVSNKENVTYVSYNQKAIKNYNKVVKHLHPSQDSVLEYPKLDRRSVRMNVYSDATFAIKMGYIIVLTDETIIVRFYTSCLILLSGLLQYGRRDTFVCACM